MNLGIARALTGSPDFATAQRIAFAFMHHTNDEAAFTEIYQGISAAEKQIVPQRIEEFLRHVTRPAVAAVLRPRLEHLLQHWRRLFNCRVPDAQRHASQHRERDGEPSPDSDGNNNIVPEALDLNSLLRQEKNISDWLRVLKRSGVRLESLPSLQAFFEAQTTDPVTLRRIRNAFKEAADLWDMVEE